MGSSSTLAHSTFAWRNITGGGGRSKFLHHWALPDEEPPLVGMEEADFSTMLSLAEEVLIPITKIAMRVVD